MKNESILLDDYLSDDSCSNELNEEHDKTPTNIISDLNGNEKVPHLVEDKYSRILREWLKYSK